MTEVKKFDATGVLRISAKEKGRIPPSKISPAKEPGSCFGSAAVLNIACKLRQDRQKERAAQEVAGTGSSKDAPKGVVIPLYSPDEKGCCKKSACEFCSRRLQVAATL